ncbi:Hypothetical_protein [Hexamita inflata]|uniref:Hypothetical_protein n=1 Tax=Hexamita inflata TaxID=28002 RepID=A0AA86UH35_9EUKA|nr:Hypothetical protein HINF_LOCUS45540 [Hexamita inflata]
MRFQRVLKIIFITFESNVSTRKFHSKSKTRQYCIKPNIHNSGEPSDSIIVGKKDANCLKIPKPIIITSCILLLCNIPINCSFSSRVQLVEPYRQLYNESNGRYSIQFLLFRFERGLMYASSYMSYCIFGPPSQNDVYLIIIKQQLYHQGWIKQDNIDHV